MFHNAKKPNRFYDAKGYPKYAKTARFGTKEAKLATLNVSVKAGTQSVRVN